MEADGLAPMVLVDGVFFQIARSGIAHMWRSLVAEWSRNGFGAHVIVVDREGTAPRFPGLRYVDAPRYDYQNTGADSRMLQGLCDALGADLFVSTYYTTPITTPSVFVAYDMIPEKLGADLSAPMWREKHYGVMHASAFLAISANTARDLASYFPFLAADSVAVAHCGVRDGLRPSSPDEIADFRGRFDLPQPYFLFVGDRAQYDGYKNAALLFKAHALLPKQDRPAILCVGGAPDLEESLRGLTDGDCRIVALDDADLAHAYSGAEVLAYPSRYEGFGMPIIEAMACGCPVIACRNSSIAEVAGEAARYVDPFAVEEMVEALAEVRRPEVRQRLIAAGQANARRFSWARMADEVAALLSRVSEELATGRRTGPPPSWAHFRRVQAEAQEWEQRSQANAWEADRAREELSAIKASRFWKMRLAWARSKGLLKKALYAPRR